MQRNKKFRSGNENQGHVGGRFFGGRTGVERPVTKAALQWGVRVSRSTDRQSQGMLAGYGGVDRTKKPGRSPPACCP